MRNAVCVSGLTPSAITAIADKCGYSKGSCYPKSCVSTETCVSYPATTRLFCFCEETPEYEKCKLPDDDEVAFFKQIIVDGECEIPEPKPDSEKLLKIHSKVHIYKTVVVDSKEVEGGEFVPGRKVLVAGFLKLGFEYSACTPDQKVHYFHCDVPFEGLVMDKDDRLLPAKFNLNEYLVHATVEQVHAEQVGPRCFSKVAILLLWLEPKNR